MRPTWGMSMNHSIFEMYCDIQRRLKQARESTSRGATERELVKEWEDAIESIDRLGENYKWRYERLIKNQSSFSPEQQDFICYQIGEWYLEWKDRIIVDLQEGTHRLGYAKEQLKTLICGD